ncbi:MAG TPA: tetratricopeptide repeat protein, partial [Isosphaeraceae bacterium]|nr:tetratricopeptide repeat protein [Isosphaeraceae bacterium]
MEWRRGLLAFLGVFLCLAGSVCAQSAALPAEAEARERRVMERFLGVLESSPRRGTAFDRVYGFHVERGTLDEFFKTYEDRVHANPSDGSAWLLIGLVQSQRGRDADAVAALRKATAARGNDPLPPFYLGQTLVLIGQPDQAAEAFEQALTRHPARADTLEIFQALGRVHQRAHRTELALGVWNRLEALFPADLRVQEQIAEALVGQNDLPGALARYLRLASNTRDRYRQAQYKLEAADIKVRLKRAPEAIADFEALLGQLDPESWLFREVRRQVEHVFLRNDDQTGLVNYYEGWLRKTPDDIGAMARLAHTLAGQGRQADARKWLDQAVKLAPGRKELRLALVDVLVADKDFAGAAAQFEVLSKADPLNPDTLRAWGQMLLKDTSQSEAQRKLAAAAVWRRLLEAKPKDPAVAVQVAELLRQAGMADEAIAHYKRAIALDPASAQYREYLGEYYHHLKRSREALETWAQIAAGNNKTARNQTRLAEVLAGFGYREGAAQAYAEACALDGDLFEPRLKYAELLTGLERFEEATAQLERAERLAADPEQTQAVLEQAIKNDQAAGRIPERIATLQKELETGQAANAALLRRLALYLEADAKLPEALVASRKALELDGRSIAAWTAVARLSEATGNLTSEVEAYRRLVALDRRAKTVYLTNIARLEARLGRADDAIRTGRDLLASGGSSPEHWQFFAELCFQLGRQDEGFDALRRSARLNDSDPKASLALAEALAKQFRTEEAIELYWRAFDKTRALDDKLALVSRLTDLYLQRSQFDRLLSRLERMGHDANEERETALCVAQAHSSAGDYGSARQVLERLLSSQSRDPQLLEQLSALAEKEGDRTTAAQFQRQLLDVAPSDEAAARLAQLYLSSGQVDLAEALWVQMSSNEKAATARLLQGVDSMLSNRKFAAARAICESMLRRDPRNWEALYRLGVALNELRQNDEETAPFQALLNLDLPDEMPSVLAAARQSAQMNQQQGSLLAGPRAVSSFPAQDRMYQVFPVRAAAGLQVQYRGNPQNTLSPADFGQARMAALGFLFAAAGRTESQGAFINRLRTACDRAPSAVRPHWDWLYFQLLQNDRRGAFEAATALARCGPGDPAALWFHLATLPGRMQGPGPAFNGAPGSSSDGTPALPTDQLDLLLGSYHTLRQR